MNLRNNSLPYVVLLSVMVLTHATLAEPKSANKNIPPAQNGNVTKKYPEFYGRQFRFQQAKGLGREKDITRRDPSDIIKVGDVYYVWYSRVDHTKLNPRKKRKKHSGYVATIWYAVSKDQGRTWTEKGEALGVGKRGQFDSFAVFTPNIVQFDHKYYLYYDAVRPTDEKEFYFANNSTTDFTAIADTPESRHFRVNNGNPILTGSHEVLIWPHRQGIAAYASKTKTLEYAPDGIDFTSEKLAVKITPKPIAPGCFRQDLTKPITYGKGIQWGIAMKDPGGPYPYLIRFEIDLAVE